MILTVVSKVDSVVQFFTVLIIFAIVLGVTWLTTRFIAGFQKGKMQGSNFELVDSFRISQNKYVQLMRIGDRYFAIAVCKDTVTVLTELPENAVIHSENSSMDTPIQFEEFFKKAKDLVKGTHKKAADKHEEDK